MMITAMSIKSLRTNTILYCGNWGETVQFYKKMLDLSVNFENQWFVEFQLTKTSFVSIADAARASIQAVGGQGVTLALMVENIDAVKKQLESRGVKTSSIQNKWGARVLYCLDPEGHRLEFWSEDFQQRDVKHE